MIRFLLISTFITTSLFSSPHVENFSYQDHDYLYFVECKTVLHDPNCHMCKFSRQVIFNPEHSFDYYIMERMDISHARYDYPMQQ